MLDVKDFYKGKTILISGCTGYLGKIILEKIIRSCQDYKTVYVMIRVKRGVKVIDRFKKEVFSSYIFQDLFQKRPELIARVAKNVIPIQGDLQAVNLGMVPEVRARLIAEVDVVLSAAASIEFVSPLQDILQVDYFGPVRMLAFAKECARKPVFCHVSTSYVNSNLPDQSLVEEKIYPYMGAMDFEKKVE